MGRPLEATTDGLAALAPAPSARTRLRCRQALESANLYAVLELLAGRAATPTPRPQLVARSSDAAKVPARPASRSRPRELRPATTRLTVRSCSIYYRKALPQRSQRARDRTVERLPAVRARPVSVRRRTRRCSILTVISPLVTAAKAYLPTGHQRHRLARAPACRRGSPRSSGRDAAPVIRTIQSQVPCL